MCVPFHVFAIFLEFFVQSQAHSDARQVVMVSGLLCRQRNPDTTPCQCVSSPPPLRPVYSAASRHAVERVNGRSDSSALFHAEYLVGDLRSNPPSHERLRMRRDHGVQKFYVVQPARDELHHSRSYGAQFRVVTEKWTKAAIDDREQTESNHKRRDGGARRSGPRRPRRYPALLQLRAPTAFPPSESRSNSKEDIFLYLLRYGVMQGAAALRPKRQV
jgi:hypothetical protein